MVEPEYIMRGAENFNFQITVLRNKKIIGKWQDNKDYTTCKSSASKQSSTNGK